jgi:hypothetical protein
LTIHAREEGKRLAIGKVLKGKKLNTQDQAAGSAK